MATKLLARELTRRGHAVRILVWRMEDDVSTEFPQEVFPREKPRNAQENRALFEKTLREERIDVVVFQCGAGWKFPFPREAAKLGVPVVSVLHTVPNSYVFRYREKYSGLSRLWNVWTKRQRQKRKYRFNSEHCACSVVLSDALRPALEAHLTKAQVRRNRVAAIGNMCVRPSEEPDFSQKKKELLFVGRMSYVEKRPDHLLHIWAKLEKRFPAWSLRFVGDGDYLPALKELAGTLGLARVFFEGFQNPEPYYREASIFCLTSAYEGFGLVLVEAASFGCVPVAFDSFAAARDIIADGENGCLVPAFDLDAYAETLARLLDARETQTEIFSRERKLMNICFFHHSVMDPLTGGIERVTAVLGQEMARRGHDVCYLARKKTQGEESDSDRQFFLSDFSSLDAFLQEKHPDIFVFQDGDDSLILGADVFSRRGIPLICCIHNDPCLFRGKIYAKYLRNFGRIFAGVFMAFAKAEIFSKSRKLAELFRKNYVVADATVLLSRGFMEPFMRLIGTKLSSNRVYAIPNPTPFSLQSVKIHLKRKELLFVGRMENGQKCMVLLLKAWARLEKRFPNWSLRLVGEGKDLPLIKKIKSVLSLERVFFEGRQAPAPYYRAASIFCMTSAYEGLPMVLIEAASFGCVPVAFDSFAAARDIIDDGGNGCLVPAFDLDAYAETLARLMSDDALRERLPKKSATCGKRSSGSSLRKRGGNEAPRRKTFRNRFLFRRRRDRRTAARGER